MPLSPTHRPRLARGVSLVICLAALILATAAGTAAEVSDKLDGDLDKDTGRYSIFVRMQDQIIHQAGDYEAFCQQHKDRPRSELRKLVLAQLREKSASSWQAVAETLGELETDGSVENVERYWIVNGFACQATGKACRTLAAHEAVSFVYRQRLRQVPLHFRPAPLAAAPGASQKKVFEDVLAKWRDDGDEKVTTAGFKIPWNVERVKADQAWTKEQATGKGIVIALCDSGLMITPSLTAALWRNPGEELNGKDDDHNGYVDDLFGYDFGNQNWYCLGDGRANHARQYVRWNHRRPAAQQRKAHYRHRAPQPADGAARHGISQGL